MNKPHVFALHVTGTSVPVHVYKGELPRSHVFKDVHLAHRLGKILRLKKGEELQLFSDQYVLEVCFQEIMGKHDVHCIISAIKRIQPLTPHLTVLLPLLKKEALHDALYTCVEMGANEIYLLQTEKTHKPWMSDQEQERMHAVMIAAAEQSKQFALPVLHAPQTLTQYLNAHKVSHTYSIYLDPQGHTLFECLTYIRSRNNLSLVITLGPEGDFTQQEKTLLQSAGFQACALTKTVLRAQQALAVALGSFRSCS